jgi:hypothetical protein
MADRECDVSFKISGSGKSEYSWSSNPTQAIAHAVADVPNDADVLAGLEALEQDCPKDCKHAHVTNLNYEVTKTWSTWGQLWDLLASIGWGEWKYSGHAEFDWEAECTCKKTPQKKRY